MTPQDRVLAMTLAVNRLIEDIEAKYGYAAAARRLVPARRPTRTL